uniref:Uncharacterized protein n=1 Tax=Virus NIOZ-UU159 TaxID=2763270 RepID=A0A7S9XGH6_9VIRU|nr:MAG: hypothetical protein NIOZUU159_00156 [Virus NIOZ-UU159]
MNNLEFNDVLNTFFKGIISGFFIAYLIMLGLRPSAEYPDNILEIIDNPWVFIVLILVNFYAIQWDITIGLLLLLSIIALLLDVIIFTEGEVFNNNINIENFKEEKKDTDLSDSSDESDSSDDEVESKDSKKKPKESTKKKKEKSNSDEDKMIEKIVSKVLKSIKDNLDDVLN